VSDQGALIVEDEGPVRHLVLNRPKKLNALDIDQHLRIRDAVRTADAEPSVRVIVLSGAGRAFCAGDDLMAGARELPDELKRRQVDLDLGTGPVLLLDSCAVLRGTSKPTVALIHGHALGSGYDYSLSCDFRVATEDANYGDPRMQRALWAAEGWSYKLPRQLNLSALAPIAYLGETMSGSLAYERGLVHRIYPAGSDLREASLPFLEELASLDPDAFAATKAQILASLDMSFEQALGGPF